MPNYEDHRLVRQRLLQGEFAGVTSLDKQAWLSELEGVKDWFGKMGDKLPPKLADIRDEFEKEFQAA
jgi:phosphoenolpyruvate carboxykinase (GTP)